MVHGVIKESVPGFKVPWEVNDNGYMPVSRVPLVHPLVDFLVVGGLSILAYVWLGFFSSIPEKTMYGVAAVLLWVGNWPHFAASAYRLYAEREPVKRYPFTALALPVLVSMAAIAAFLWPKAWAPWLVKGFLWWSPYHFSGQTVGISLLYAKRAGVTVTAVERRVLSAFVLGTFLFPQISGEATKAGGTYYGIEYPTFGLPKLVGQATGLALALSALFLAYLIYRRWKDGESPLPLWCWLPPLTQFIWFVPGGHVERYYTLVPFFHGAQYLLVAGVMQARLRQARVGERSTKFTVKAIAKWFSINVAVGGLLFVALPGIVTWQTGRTAAFCAGILGIAVQIHHFFVDGVVWKLRDPRVAAPLTSSAQPLAA